MKQVLTAVSFAGSLANGLHVTQWQDSMTVLSNQFILLENENVQNFLGDAADKPSIQQDLNIELVSEH